MADCMTFPDTVEEFMEQYKITDTEHIYTNGTELVPIFRMKQWFDHKPEPHSGRRVYQAGYADGFEAGQPHWIPCSERLPEEGERVLATHLGGLNPNRQVIEHIYQNGEFTCGWEMDTDFHSRTFGQRFMGNVIAWMPLPECYQEDI